MPRAALTSTAPSLDTGTGPRFGWAAFCFVIEACPWVSGDSLLPI
jgi:hypothetical protein